MSDSGTPDYFQPFDLKLNVQVPMSDRCQSLD